MKTFHVSTNDHGQPIVQVVANKLRISKKQAKKLLDAKKVFVNGKRLWMAQSPLTEGDKIEVQEVVKHEVNIGSNAFLYRDEELLIIDKPPGITTNGDESLELHLRGILKVPSLLAVHRLDRDTSGCVIFAMSKGIKDKLEELFRKKSVVKHYSALVYGWVPGEIEEIKKALDGKPALTKVSIVSANQHASHVRLQILTGRMHQIRRHMAAIRHPVIGDKDYATERVDFGALRMVERQMLHATSLEFESPF